MRAGAEVAPEGEVLRRTVLAQRAHLLRWAERLAVHVDNELGVALVGILRQSQD